MKDHLHPPEVSFPEGNYPIIAPIYQTAKFVLGDNTSEQFIYTRVSNPTLRQLELTLSKIGEREDTILFSSGMAAITGTMMGLLKAGDHVVGFRETYKPARMLMREVLPKFGIETTVVSIKDCPQLETFIKPGKTKVIYFEGVSNPHSLPAPMETLVKVARAHNILLVMDGTLTGIHRPWPEVDLVIQSLTKYANGHGDVIAGSVSGKASLIKSLRPFMITMGATLDPHAAYLIQRGLRTYFMRYERHSKTALEVAKSLAQNPLIKSISYPGLHEKALYEHMGGVMTFELDPKVGTAFEFCHRMKMIQFAVSLGSSETLICPTEKFFGDDLSPSELKEMGLNPYTIRVCIGLEDAKDILEDLEQGLNSHHR